MTSMIRFLGLMITCSKYLTGFTSRKDVGLPQPGVANSILEPTTELQGPQHLEVGLPVEVTTLTDWYQLN